MILSFLGGARWGQEVASAAPDPRLIALSMAPSVAAWALALLPPGHAGLQLAGLAGALVLHLLWDLLSQLLQLCFPIALSFCIRSCSRKT